MKRIVITLLLAFLFLLNIPIFAEESKLYTNQDLYKPTQTPPKDLFKEAGISPLSKPLSTPTPQQTKNEWVVVEETPLTKKPIQELKFEGFKINDPLEPIEESEKSSFTFLGNEYEINVKQINILIGIAVGIVVVVFFIFLLKKKKTKVIYYSIFSVFIIVGIGIFSIFYFRHETAAVGRWDLKYDKFDKIVYMKFAFKPDAPWKKTRFKSLRQAQYFLEKRERQEATEDATREIQDKLEEVQTQIDEVPHEIQRQKFMDNLLK